MVQATTPVHRNRTGKYLLVRIGREEYGFPVLKIREIIGKQPTSQVPHTPEFVTGVINLRGKVIPVVDLRIRFGLRSENEVDRTCTVVVQVEHGGSSVQIGAIVDEVLNVVTIAEEEIEDTPDFGGDAHTPYILGMAKHTQGVRILLDSDTLLNWSTWISPAAALAR